MISSRTKRKRERNRLISKGQILRRTIRAALSFVLDQVLRAAVSWTWDLLHQGKQFHETKLPEMQLKKRFWEVAELLKAYIIGVFVQARKQMITKGEMFNGIFIWHQNLSGNLVKMQQAQLGSGEKAEILVWGIVSDIVSSNGNASKSTWILVLRCRYYPCFSGNIKKNSVNGFAGIKNNYFYRYK